MKNNVKHFIEDISAKHAKASQAQVKKTYLPPLPKPRIPLATYRLQFNCDFTFNQAREIVPYLSALGISH